MDWPKEGELGPDLSAASATEKATEDMCSLPVRALEGSHEVGGEK
jgi:hypothetical protein